MSIYNPGVKPKPKSWVSAKSFLGEDKNFLAKGEKSYPLVDVYGHNIDLSTDRYAKPKKVYVRTRIRGPSYFDFTATY
jgi:hypothetical protein